MKKTLLLVAAAVALVACSNEETVRQSAPEAIGFDNAFVENSTRSVNDPSFDADNMFSDFAVYGYVEGATLFDGTRVAKVGDAGLTDFTDQENTDWKYNGTVYWIAGANYKFHAVAPLTDGGWTNNGTVADQAALSFTNNGTTDLLYGYYAEQGKVSGNDYVAFTFRHILSKVKFSFKNDYNATNATIRVKNIQITDAYATGNVVLTDANTTWSAQNGTLLLNFGNAATTAVDAEQTIDHLSTVESYNELLMIPGAGPAVVDAKNTYTVTFTVDLLVGGSVVKSYNHIINAEFAPVAGNSYNLTATINPENIDPANEQEPIEFTVTAIDGWDEDYNDEAEGDNNVTI